MWPQVPLEGVGMFFPLVNSCASRVMRCLPSGRCDGRQAWEARQEWGHHLAGLMGLFFWNTEPGIYHVHLMHFSKMAQAAANIQHFLSWEICRLLASFIRIIIILCCNCLLFSSLLNIHEPCLVLLISLERRGLGKWHMLSKCMQSSD